MIDPTNARSQPGRRFQSRPGGRPTDRSTMPAERHVGRNIVLKPSNMSKDVTCDELLGRHLEARGRARTSMLLTKSNQRILVVYILSLATTSRRRWDVHTTYQIDVLRTSIRRRKSDVAFRRISTNLGMSKFQSTSAFFRDFMWKASMLSCLSCIMYVLAFL